MSAHAAQAATPRIESRNIKRLRVGLSLGNLPWPAERFESSIDLLARSAPAPASSVPVRSPPGRLRRRAAPRRQSELSRKHNRHRRSCLRSVRCCRRWRGGRSSSRACRARPCSRRRRRRCCRCSRPLEVARAARPHIREAAALAHFPTGEPQIKINVVEVTQRRNPRGQQCWFPILSRTAKRR